MTITRNDAYSAVDRLADWSVWAPFGIAARTAPLTPGVYQMRTRDGLIVYVGMAGERKGQGVRGRLSIYRRGKGAVSGFGEAALDRALANAAFVEEHLEAVRDDRPARASEWARDAIQWLDVEIRWAECATKDDADSLEKAVIKLLMPHSIWNRIASRTPHPRRSADERSASSDCTGTVAELAGELARTNKAVRRALRAGFPDHTKRSSWDPLSAAQIAYVRMVLSR
jgi:hypothetical protein